jgi:hypothetical protein
MTVALLLLLTDSLSDYSGVTVSSREAVSRAEGRDSSSAYPCFLLLPNHLVTSFLETHALF